MIAKSIVIEKEYKQVIKYARKQGVFRNLETYGMGQKNFTYRCVEMASHRSTCNMFYTAGGTDETLSQHKRYDKFFFDNSMTT